MKINVIKKATLQDLPSASGIEIVNGIIYIVGDDSPFLYCLDHSLKIIHQVELYKTDQFSSGRIPKSQKRDLECMTSLIIKQNHYLLILGSGANEQRDTGFLVKLPTKFNKNYIVQEISFKSLYDLLRSNEEIVGTATLNLEGAAASDSKLILLNRANGNAPNTALVFNLEEFEVFLTENQDMLPFPEIIPYELPNIRNTHAGFSGASIFEDNLFFTASVEVTEDAISDGEILGSFVGTIHINKSNFGAGKYSKSLETAFKSSLIQENDAPFQGKVESMAMYTRENENTFVALAVTDNDEGNSEIIMMEIALE